ncbi:MAG: S41 family peptidase [Candidatus Cyclobacteriaceae bacterium M2_1C_046]
MGRKSIFIFLAGILIVFASLSFSKPGDRYFEIAKNLDIFASLFKEVNALYVDEINPNELIQTGIYAMLASLDPYTNYIPEDKIEDFRTQSTGQYGGIGAVTGIIDDKIRILMIYEGFSAHQNGLKVGDEVIKIDNIKVEDISREEANDLMRGQLGSPLNLTVKRYGQDEPITLNFVREQVTIENIPYKGMLTEDIGYVKLNEFTMKCGRDVRNAVGELKEEGAKKIILDLRGNPGGLLMEAVNIANIFIPKGTEVVSTRGKVEENNISYSTLNHPLDTDIPVAVLINSTSASASEIVAGTLQDYDRAVVIGQKSFGKGLVQISRPLTYNSQVKITTAKYYTPSGRCIQAIDYSYRNPDGSPGKMPDSLHNEFKTRNGRVVYDGGGIDPDIKTENQEMTPIVFTLMKKGLIFNYASIYAHNHPEIADARTFSLTDEEYVNFISWLSEKDLSYETEVERNLEKLVAKAKEEQYYEAIKNDLTQLKDEIIKSKANDLQQNKDQIKLLLEEEIASRYYLQKGSVESVFDEDPEIIEAIEVLNNRDKYNQILNF